jgi:cholesterol oxidase
MKPRYDAIVIGTGFGGAVTACRLAQVKPKLSVGVLERGRRYPMGSFPRNFGNLKDGWLWQDGRGLLDVRPINEMTVVQCAGYGGGSLIYANVQVRPPASVFESGWPPGYSLEELGPYYDLVAYMLDIKPITSGVSGLPSKTTAMQKAACELGRESQFFYPNLAVDLGRPGVLHQNKFGADQQSCTYCGECDIGCNIHAKNTLDLNYLKVAETEGADITTQCEVLKIGPSNGGYRVTFRDHDNDSEGSTEADRVFVCAGSVNSTELLLRCRDEYGSLGKLNGYLGHGYSSNGDFYTFAFNTESQLKPSYGPTITTALVYDRKIGDERIWFLLEEGGYPAQIAQLVQILNPKAGLLKRVEKIRLFEDLYKAIGSIFSLSSANQSLSNSDNSAVFLTMGRDRANGILKLTPGGASSRLWIHWDVPSNLPLYDTEAQLSTDFAKAFGGEVAFNPLWKILHVPLSVHNLGGCTMASQPGLGVTDPYGEVYEYPKLYVLDGAILPGATGVNPSHTIAAVAERNVEAAIRKMTANPKWVAPEMNQAPKIVDPISTVTIPRGGTAAPKTPSIQVSFDETMCGFVQKGFQPPDYQKGYEAGRLSGSSAEFTVTIKTPNFDEFIAYPPHKAVVSGLVKLKNITDPEGSRVRAGSLSLFVADRDSGFYHRKMIYHLLFTGRNGRDYVLEGFKDVRDHGYFDVWTSTTTLFMTISEPGGSILATGILRISLPNFLQHLTTFEVSGTDNPIEKTRTLALYGRLFLGTLFDVFVRPKVPGA